MGVVAAGLTPSVNTGAIPSSRSSNKAISEKKSIDMSARKVLSASSGVATSGSWSLNDVFKTMGTPVRSRNLVISAWNNGAIQASTSWRRHVPLRWMTAGMSDDRAGRTG